MFALEINQNAFQRENSLKKLIEHSTQNLCIYNSV